MFCFCRYALRGNFFAAMCGLARPWQSLLIGSTGSVLGELTVPLLEKFEVDDPVGVIPVHLVAAIWGLLAPGLFLDKSAPMVGDEEPRFTQPTDCYIVHGVFCSTLPTLFFLITLVL